MRISTFFTRSELQEFLGDFYEVKCSAATSVSISPNPSSPNSLGYNITLESSGAGAEILLDSLKNGMLRRWGSKFVQYEHL